jgi:hypothetical protein
MPSLNPPIPLNARTVIYCILMGLVLSAPLGMFPEGHLLFEPPSAAKRIYLTSVSASYFLLPFWALFSMRKHPLLTLSALLACAFGFRIIFPILG